MPDEITGAISTGKRLALLKGTSMFVVEDNGNEPHNWPVHHLAGVGTSEEFVEMFSGELIELMGACAIYDPERQTISEAIMTILVDGLIPAFEHLKKVRASVAEQMPLVNRWQLYDDFSRQLWYAYKELMPKATLLLGFDLGFLFQKDSNFEAGVLAFNNAHPSLIANVGDYLRRQREHWQNGLAEFRNQFLEHRQADREQFAVYYQPNSAEVLFKSVWQTMADLFAVFIESHFRESFSIEPVPPAERDPKRLRRFRYIWVGPSQVNEEPAPQ